MASQSPTTQFPTYPAFRVFPIFPALPAFLAVPCLTASHHSKLKLHGTKVHITVRSMPSFMGISLLDYTDPENYMYYGGAAAVILLIIGVIMKKRGTFEKIKKVSLRITRRFA